MCNIEKVGGPGDEAILVLDSTRFSSEAAGCGLRHEDTSVTIRLRHVASFF